MNKEKSALEKIEEKLKEYWRKDGNASVIAAKHTEFMVEPKVFIGDQLNPEILKLIVINYLAQSSKHIEATPEKLVIKSPKGKPLVIVRDQKIIQQYLASRV